MSQQQPRPSGIDYDRIVREQMVGIVRRVLGDVAERGLPHGHHFYLSFASQHSQVGMPDWLKQRYPEEVTIVLQHEFWDLEVDDTGLAVTLSFNQRPERLRVPFNALTRFADPYAPFQVELRPLDDAPAAAPAAPAAAPEPIAAPEAPVAEGDNVIRLPFGRK